MKYKFNALDNYVKSVPKAQNAVDIFKGDWSSELPPIDEPLTSGSIPLFSDGRIAWAIDQFQGVSGKDVLELGPLEGGHSFMLENAGASEIVAIEANASAFLKCLIVKEIYGLQRVRFRCGDFVEYLRANKRKFDVGIACGVLYHMLNPLELIALLGSTVDKLFIWTHYYDEKIIRANPALASRFRRTQTCSFEGIHVTGHRQEYQAAVEWTGFCGGSASTSVWLPREDILRCTENFGLRILDIAFEEPEHPNGPCFAFAAERTR
jgi:hypothetical protein